MPNTCTSEVIKAALDQPDHPRSHIPGPFTAHRHNCRSQQEIIPGISADASTTAAWCGSARAATTRAPGGRLHRITTRPGSRDRRVEQDLEVDVEKRLEERVNQRCTGDMAKLGFPCGPKLGAGGNAQGRDGHGEQRSDSRGSGRVVPGGGGAGAGHCRAWQRCVTGRGKGNRGRRERKK